MKTKSLVCSIVLILLFQLPAHSQVQPASTLPSGKIAAGSKVFIAPMPDEFDTYLKAAMTSKKVPLIMVDSRGAEDFIIAGASETEKASIAKKVILLNWHSSEDASIRVSDAKTGVVVYAYTAVKKSSVHGKQSTAEACAKHLKEKVDSGK